MSEKSETKSGIKYVVNIGTDTYEMFRPIRRTFEPNIPIEVPAGVADSIAKQPTFIEVDYAEYTGAVNGKGGEKESKSKSKKGKSKGGD